MTKMLCDTSTDSDTEREMNNVPASDTCDDAIKTIDDAIDKYDDATTKNGDIAARFFQAFRAIQFALN